MENLMDRLTVGVEEEFFLLGGTGQLVGVAPEALAGTTTDADLKGELMRSQIESATRVCRTGPEVHAELLELRTRLAKAAEEQGARLVPSGCVPHRQHEVPAIGPGHRYRRMAQLYGPLVFGGPTCGCHVHVGCTEPDMSDPAVAVQVCNHLRQWLPVLLALGGNSAVHEDGDTGYASTRHLLWGRWPTAGPPPYLRSPEHFDSVVDDVLATGAALDRKMIYWDVRPSEAQPTVEIRVPDVLPTAADAALLAVLVRTLVADALERVRAGESADPVAHEVLRARMWRAARDGITRPVLDALDRQFHAHDGALRALGERDFVDEALERLRTHGGGADRQRAAFERGGADAVVELLAGHALDH